MIEDLTEAQAKDRILKYCIQEKHSIIPSTELQNEVFKNSSVDDVKFLLQKISSECIDLDKVNLNSQTKYISTNKASVTFLKQGGFTKIESESSVKSNFL